jgi:hypothetical protein
MTIRERIQDIMIQYPEARNDDRVLYFLYLKKHHGLALEEIMCKLRLEENLDRGDVEPIPAFEAIRRRRQEIQNEDKVLIPTDPDVIHARGFFKLGCPAKMLMEAGFDPEYSRGACRRCSRRQTHDCELWGRPRGLAPPGIIVAGGS